MSEQSRITSPLGEPYGMYIGDSRTLSDILNDNFDSNQPIDTTITSPPYADKKNYNAAVDEQIGFGQSYEEYLEELRNVFKQVYDQTKETGTLWVVVNTIKRDQRVVRLPFDIADVCENLNGITTCPDCDTQLQKERESGILVCPGCDHRHNPLDESWRLQDIVIWDKNRARPWSREGQLRNVFEYILCFSKSNSGFKFDLDSIRVADTEDFEDWWVKYPERYNPRGKVPHNIWDFTTPTQGSWGSGDVDHPAPFPAEMVARIINLTTEPQDTVFDPFAGTGQVLAQAEAMDRRPVGVELSEDYAEMYRDRRDKIVSEWDAAETLEEQQAQLEQVIGKLRQLKYPRELTRRIRHQTERETLAELKINTMFQLSHEVIDREKFDEDHLLMEDDLYVVLDNDASTDHTEEIRRAAHECAAEPPCSKFGIKPNITVLTTEEMKDVIETGWGWPDNLSIYDNDVYYSPAGTMATGEWAANVEPSETWRENRAKNEYPPILSNLEIDVPDPRDVDGNVSLEDIFGEREQTVADDDDRTTLSDFQ